MNEIKEAGALRRDAEVAQAARGDASVVLDPRTAPRIAGGFLVLHGVVMVLVEPASVVGALVAAVLGGSLIVDGRQRMRWLVLMGVAGMALVSAAAAIHERQGGAAAMIVVYGGAMVTLSIGHARREVVRGAVASLVAVYFLAAIGTASAASRAISQTLTKREASAVVR